MTTDDAFLALHQAGLYELRCYCGAELADRKPTCGRRECRQHHREQRDKARAQRRKNSGS